MTFAPKKINLLGTLRVWDLDIFMECKSLYDNSEGTRAVEVKEYGHGFHNLVIEVMEKSFIGIKIFIIWMNHYLYNP